VLGTEPQGAHRRSDTVTQMMARSGFPILVVFAALAASSCTLPAGRPVDADTAELRQMLMETRRDLDEIRRDQDRLRDQIEYLQYSQGSPPPGARGASEGGWPADPWGQSGGGANNYGAAPAPNDYAAAAPPPGGSRPGAPLIYNDPTKPDRVPPPAEAAPGGSRIVMGVREGGSWTEPGKIGVDAPNPTVPDALRGSAYEDGVRAFGETHYEDAIQYFRDFIHKNPQSEYADDAQYWVGECYLRKELYSNAIKEFNQVVLRYGSGDRSAAALLKLAEVFSKIGDQVDARLSLQKLVNRYPGSSEAAEAYRLLKEMGT